MANAVKGETTLTLSDDRELTLVLDMEALVQAEGAYGKPLAGLMHDASEGFFGASRAMLWGALRRKHPGVSLAECSTIFAENMESVGAALEKAADLAFPNKTEGKSGNVKSRQRGKSNGGNGAKRA